MDKIKRMLAGVLSEAEIESFESAVTTAIKSGVEAGIASERIILESELSTKYDVLLESKLNTELALMAEEYQGKLNKLEESMESATRDIIRETISTQITPSLMESVASKYVGASVLRKIRNVLTESGIVLDPEEIANSRTSKDAVTIAKLNESVNELAKSNSQLRIANAVHTKASDFDVDVKRALFESVSDIPVETAISLVEQKASALRDSRNAKLLLEQAESERAQLLTEQAGLRKQTPKKAKTVRKLKSGNVSVLNEGVVADAAQTILEQEAEARVASETTTEFEAPPSKSHTFLSNLFN